MKITYYGENCFMLSHKNIEILIDPHNDVSIENSNNIKIIFTNELSRSLFNNSCKYTANNLSKDLGNIQIDLLPTYCDNLNGQKRGLNNILLIYFDKIKLCHLGQIGHIPSDDVIKKLGSIDLLMIPIGGNFTIDYKKAINICKKISPKNILPMNYNYKSKQFPKESIDNFIIQMKNSEVLPYNSFEFNSTFLQNDKKVLVLSN